MPEGPEIHRVADRLSGALVGQRMARVRFGLARLRGYEARLTGRCVTSVRAHGKALLTRFDSGHVLYSHNQLYGRWYVVAPGRPPRTRRSLRVALEGEARWALLYSASDIDVLNEDELKRHPFLSRPGPDVLDSRTTPAKIRRRLCSRAFGRRQLGALLLDPSFLAGIGNDLRSEVLFFSGLAPGSRPSDLGDSDLRRLARTIRAVAQRSYRTPGVTEEASYVQRARADGEPRRSWRHAVFGRRGRACRRCRTTILQATVAGRRLFACPSCQPVLGVVEEPASGRVGDPRTADS